MCFKGLHTCVKSPENARSWCPSRVSGREPAATAGPEHSLCSEDPPFRGLLHNPSQSTKMLPARLSGNELAIAQVASHRESGEIHCL